MNVVPPLQLHLHLHLHLQLQRFGRSLWLTPLVFALAGALHSEPLSLEFGVGASNQDLRWNIATDLQGTPPNIQSELSWHALSGPIGRVQLNWSVTSDWQLRFGLESAAFAWGGWMQDSDYAGNNRSAEFARSRSSNEGSWSDAAWLLFGRSWKPEQELPLTLQLDAGARYARQWLHITHGVQQIPASGPFSGLDSKYSNEQNSQVLQLGARWPLREDVRMEFSLGHEWVTYQARADWNMRSDFEHPVSYSQNGNGEAETLHLRLLRRCDELSDVGVQLTARHFWLFDGRDITYNSNGTRDTTVLRELESNSADLTFVYVRRLRW